MKLLNLGAGGTLPGHPWVNVDFPYEHPEMGPHYVRHDVSARPWPFEGESADGIIACHLLEHFECLEAVLFLKECLRILKPGGVLRVVVPDASHFRRVYAEDAADPHGNAVRLFGEPLSGRELAKGVEDKTFMSFALFWADHKQLLTEDSLWCELVNAGFNPDRIAVTNHKASSEPDHYCATAVAQLDNRELFSLRMEAFKR